MGVLEEIVKNAIKLSSIIDLVKHFTRLNPLVAYYIKVNLKKTNAVKKAHLVGGQNQPVGFHLWPSFRALYLLSLSASIQPPCFALLSPSCSPSPS